MNKKSYTSPSLTSEKIFQESSVSCVYDIQGDLVVCKKGTVQACEYQMLPDHCTIIPYNS